LATFDFLSLPELPKAKVLALADGSFVRKRENVICLGQPGTGKPITRHYPFGDNLPAARHGRGR
jgi:IstB-like ATP binding protein